MTSLNEYRAFKELIKELDEYRENTVDREGHKTTQEDFDRILLEV